MTISELICKEAKGLVYKIRENNCRLLDSFIKRCFEDNADPQRLYYDYWPKTGKMHDLNTSLLEDYPLEPRSDSSRKKLFFSGSIRNVSVSSIIRSQSNGQFVLGKNHIRTYNRVAYRELVDISIAMIITDFDIRTLYKEHIIFVILYSMFIYFRVFDADNHFIINPKDAIDVYGEIVITDISYFEEVAQKYKFANNNENNIPILCKPTCAEDLTSCFEEGYTQSEKKEAIMKWWRCSERTARRYMKQFGLTELKYARSDYKELHQHLDDVEETLSSQLEQVKEDLNTCIENNKLELFNRIVDNAQKLSESDIGLSLPSPA